jgi:hypothetical protein
MTGVRPPSETVIEHETVRPSVGASRMGSDRVTEIIHDGPSGVETRITEIIREGHPGSRSHGGSRRATEPISDFPDPSERMGDPSDGRHPISVAQEHNVHNIGGGRAGEFRFEILCVDHDLSVESADSGTVVADPPGATSDKSSRPGILGGRGSKAPSVAVRRDDPYDDQPHVQGDPSGGGESVGRPAVSIAATRRPGSAPGGDAILADPREERAQPKVLAVHEVA